MRHCSSPAVVAEGHLPDRRGQDPGGRRVGEPRHVPFVEPVHDPVTLARRRRLVDLEAALASLRELRAEVEAVRPGLVPDPSATWHSRAAEAYADRREAISQAIGRVEVLLVEAEAAVAAEADRLRAAISSPSPDDLAWLLGDDRGSSWAT